MAEQMKMAREYLEKNKVEIKCPYCTHLIGNWQVKYLFNLNQKREDFSYASINRLIKLSSDEKLKSHWDYRGVKDIQGTFGINPMRCVCSLEDLERLQREMESSGELDGLEEFSVNFNEETKAMDICIQEDNTRRVYTDEFVCPRCHNLLPPSIFRSQMVRIGLCGSQNSGKTVWICSLEKSAEQFIENGSSKMDIFFSFPENSSDGITAKYTQYIRELKKNPGVAPEGTKLLMAPVFFDFYYREKDYLVVVYDVSGEIQEGAQRHSVALQHFNQIDGYIMMLDPEILPSSQKILKESISKRVVPLDKQLEEAKNQCRLLNEEEQIMMQNRKDFISKTIGKLLDELKIDEPSRTDSIQNNIEQRRSPMEIMRMIAADLDMRKRKEQHMALVLDKGDLLKIPECMSALKKNTLELPLIENKIMMATDYITDRMYCGESVLLGRAGRFFGSVSCHVLSALGCDVNKEPNEHYRELKGEFAPFGTVEPLIKIINTMETRKVK